MDEEKKYSLDELQEKLTEKERIFCHEYIIDWNGARSARKAGYSENNAKETAYENLTKPHIQQFLDFIKDDIAKEAGISKLKVLLEQKKIAFSSIAHLHETWIKRKQFDKLTDEEKSCISEISTQIKVARNVHGELEENEYIKIKLHDKQKALESINKMMGYNEAEKVDHTIKGLTIEWGDKKIDI